MTAPKRSAFAAAPRASAALREEMVQLVNPHLLKMRRSDELRPDMHDAVLDKAERRIPKRFFLGTVGFKALRFLGRHPPRGDLALLVSLEILVGHAAPAAHRA